MLNGFPVSAERPVNNADVVDVRNLSVTEGMSRNPRHIQAEALAVDAAVIMDSHKLNQMLVSDEQGKLIGALHMHDLMTAKVV